MSTTRENLDKFISSYSTGSAYDLDNELILNHYPERVIELTPRHDSILELGIGHGFSTFKFNQHFNRHVVIDASPAVIKTFNQAYPDMKVDVVSSYFEDFQTDETFDLISMGFVLEHVDDPGLLLTKFRGFLKPDGILAITVPNGESLHRRFAHAAGMLTNMLEMGAGDKALGHQRLFSVDSLARLLEDSDFSIRCLEGLFLKPLTTTQLISLNLPREVLNGMMVVGRSYPELCTAILVVAYVR
jgi:trans-aconitate methyltransferase